MKIDLTPKFEFSDVLIRPKQNFLQSRGGVVILRKFQFQSAATWSAFPVVAANMDTVGTIAMAKALLNEDALVSLHKFYPLDELVRFFRSDDSRNTFYTLGIGDDDLSKFDAVLKLTSITKISIDVANGYIQKFRETVGRIREKCANATIMAGTVVTPEITRELIEVGANIVRIGIGSGSVCTTRDVTGVGMPQLSAVLECAQAAHESGGMICADGGCRTSGDIAKALGAGADFVMLGGMLAGHDECEGTWNYETIDGTPRRKSLTFYGMASINAMEKRYGGVAPHRAAEGKMLEIPYKGPVSATLREIKGGVRSMMTYVGADNIEDIPTHVGFVLRGGHS